MRETKAPRLRSRGKLPLGLKKASHAGIIRIGFEGVFSAPQLVEHPCFNNTIETLQAGKEQMRARRATAVPRLLYPGTMIAKRHFPQENAAFQRTGMGTVTEARSIAWLPAPGRPRRQH